MSPENPRQSREGFYIDKDGKPADASIHYPILDDVDPAVDYKHRVASFHRAVEAGVDPEMAARAFGIEGGFELGGGSLAPDSSG